MSHEEPVVTVAAVEAALTSSLSPLTLRVFDVSGGCGAKFDLFIGSAAFSGLSLLARHRLVQEALKNAGLAEKIHAITIKAWTPEEWEKKKDTIPSDMN